MNQEQRQSETSLSGIGTTNTNIESTDLNLYDGFSTMVLDQIIQHHLQTSCIKQHQEQLQHGTSIMVLLLPYWLGMVFIP
jgi:hypothetical protein